MSSGAESLVVPEPDVASDDSASLETSYFASAWVRPCVFIGKATGPCRFSSIAKGPDGTIFIAGSAYSEVDLGLEPHSSPANQYMLLAAYRPDGTPVWSRSFGTQWHNYAHEVRVIGDQLIVVGVGANDLDVGGRTFPRIQVDGPERTQGYKAEVGFVAAYGFDGSLRWAKRMTEITDGTVRRAGGPGLDYWRTIFEDGGTGFWLRYSDEEYRVAHLDAQGNTLSGYAFERPDSSLFMFEGPGWIGTEGDLWRIERDPKRAEISVVRTGPRGEVWRTPLAPLPQPLGPPDPEGPRSKIFTWLVVDAVGRMHGVLVESGSGSRRDVDRAFLTATIVTLEPDGRLSSSIPLFEPIVQHRRAHKPAELVELLPRSRGGFRVVVNHIVDLTVAGARVSGPKFRSSEDPHPGTLTIIDVAAEGDAIESVATFGGDPCLAASFSSPYQVIEGAGDVYMVGESRSSADLEFCRDDRALGNVLTRLEPS